MPKAAQSSQVRQLAGLSPSSVFGYVLAIIGVGVSTVIALQLGPISREAPFLIFLPAVLLSLWYAGYYPALLAIILSGLAVDYFLILPLHTLMLSESGIIKEAVYTLSLGVSFWLIDRSRRQAVQEIALRDRMIESSPQPIIITDLGHCVTYWNAGAAAVYGWSAEEVLGRKLADLLHPVYPEPIADLDRKLHRDGHWRGILYQRSKSGEEIITGCSWTFDAGTGSILQSNIVITDRIHAERLAQESSAKLQAAIESIGDAFMICDASGKMVECNEAFARYLRFPSKHSSPKDLDEVWNVIDVFYTDGTPVPIKERPIHRALAGETASQVELMLCRRDTGEAWTGSYSFAPLRGPDGQVTAAVLMARDVTWAREMEREVRRVNRALGAISRINQLLMQSHELSEATLYQRAVEVIADESGYALAWIGVSEQDEEKSIRAAAVAGRAGNFARNLKLTWADIPTGQSPASVVLRQGAVCVVQNYQDDPSTAPGVDVAAEYGFHSMIALPVKVEGMTVAALMVYSEEIGAFDRQEVELFAELARDLAFGIATIRTRIGADEERQLRIQAEAQLLQAQKLEAIGTLAGGIAHDFNNLLMVIMAQIEVLLFNLEGEQAQRAAAVQKSAGRAAELTSQLLAFSRKQVIQPTVTSINAILQDFLPMTTRLLREDIEVKLSLCSDVWPVRIDRSQFEQVVMNLVVNARDAMPDGGMLTLETANVLVGGEYIRTHPLVPAGRYSLCAITDTGTGMSPEVQAHIFEPFYTTKGVDKGTGLGLAMVYGIVKQSGGFIWVYSEPGKGSSFKIYLPIAETGASVVEEVFDRQPVRARYKTSILLVEDDSALRSIVGEFLESAGHKVFAAENPQEAMKIAAATTPAIELLLTDVVLKGGNGKVLAERLSAMDARLKVVFMSGYTPNAIVHHGVLDPGVQFLQKPFSRATLLHKIDDIMEKERTKHPPILQSEVAASSSDD